MSELVRLLHREEGEKRVDEAPSLVDWLDFVEGERDRTIAKLRQLDGILVKHGRLKVETLPRRVR